MDLALFKRGDLVSVRLIIPEGSEFWLRVYPKTPALSDNCIGMDH